MAPTFGNVFPLLEVNTFATTPSTVAHLVNVARCFVPEGLEAELTEVASESDVAISTLQEFKPIDFGPLFR
jgi:hypothetical protein